MTRLLALCVVLVARVATAEVELPQGWRRPAAAQNEVCAEGADPYRVQADFDGDGHADEARLLIKAGSTLGLWIWMADRAPFLLFHWRGVADGHHPMGIALVAGPDSSETWCGRHGECFAGDTERVSWAHPSIGFYRCESSGRLIYWDGKRRSFRTALISD